MLGVRKRVLMIGNEGVVLFGPSPKGGIEREASISWELPNFEIQLTAALIRKNIYRQVMILFDGSDNTFKKETNVPKLGAIDRKKYIKRKLDQSFASYPVRTMMEVTTPEEIKEKRPRSYLFVAITDMEKINRIIRCLIDSGLQVSGLGILPIEAEGLITELGKKLVKGSKSRWTVLVGQHEDGGLRQVIVKDGKMSFTRITPTSEAGIQGETWANVVINEYKATETYLSRLGFKPDDGLDIIVICSDVEKQFFESQSFKPGDNFICATTEHALASIGFKKNLVGNINFSDVLYAAWNSKRASLTLPIGLAALDNIKWPRMVASSMGVLIFLSIIALAYYDYNTFDEYILTGQEIDKQESQKRILSREYEDEAQVFKKFPVPLEVVKGTLAVNKYLNENVFKLTPTLNVLRSVLPRDIKLSNLDLEYVPPSDSKSGGIMKSQEQKDKEASRRMRVKFDFILVKDMSLEEKVVRAENLLVLLKERLPGYTVEISKQFGNVSRDQGFSGTSKDGDKTNSSVENDMASMSIEGPAL